MKKRIGLIAALVIAFTGVVYAQNVSTDYGGKDVINHSNGVLIMPYNKMLNSKNVCTNNPDAGVPLCSNYLPYAIGYYTTVAEYPTSFQPTVSKFDAGCQKHQLAENPLIPGLSGRTDGGPVFCSFEIPFSVLDAGVYTFYRETDGGFGLSQCPAIATIGTTSFPAFCNVQMKRLP